ncbi:MAG: ABC transporter substrate-binding protein [Deltaproteobacteria bacterium]|nr:ABC transporter substrate-binding protein [Deltaproteobacteria bacterium]MBI2182436.1 ABC transporter substrate-binding protein [Deltaproteobacteria bacterium]MBI2231688.1 ABC transporter substrate-binding protein [Deltaproteobacteria bacterium]MBI2368088.1 ABC transporter substrate-binding protein [Deltaproteobacteria bacterium]
MKRKVWKSFFSLAFFVLGFLISFPIGSVTAAVALRVAYPQPSGALLPLWLVSEARLDQKYGAPVQNIFLSGAARINQSMIAGDIDLASVGGAVVHTVLAGGDLVAIAVGVPTYGFSLYGRAEVKDIKDLQGKVVGIMSKGSSSEHAVIALLQRHNLLPGKDVKFVYLGGVREVVAAIDRGIVSAGVLSAPTTLIARRLGQKELVNIATLGLPYIHSGVATRRSLARQQPERIKSYLRAYIAAIKVANEDAETSKRALARYLVTNDAAILEEAYQTFRGVFPRVPYVAEDYIKSVLAVSDHPKAAGAKPGDFFDNRYLKEIEDSGFVQELYGRR